MSSQALFTSTLLTSFLFILAKTDDFSCTVTQDEDLSITGTQTCDILVVEGTLHIASNTHLSANHIDIRSTGSLLIGDSSFSVTDAIITMNSVADSKLSESISATITNDGTLNLHGAHLQNTVLECHSGSVCSLICSDTGCDGMEMYCDEDALCDLKCDEETECPKYKIVSQQEKELMIHHEIIDDFEAMEGVDIRPIGHVFSTLNLMEIFAICSIVSFTLLGLCVRYMRFKEKEYELL